MRHQTLEHRFVKHIPDSLEPGILYVSMEYGSVAHACCCGCGEEVVTPLTPTDWRLTFDGESISLSPSVGSWTLPCRSHYVITRNRVRVADPWSENQIAAERHRDRRTKARHYGRDVVVDKVDEKPNSKSSTLQGAGWLRRVWTRISGK